MKPKLFRYIESQNNTKTKIVLLNSFIRYTSEINCVTSINDNYFKDTANYFNVFLFSSQGQGISIWIQIARSQHIRLTEGIDIERIFQANYILQTKIFLLFLILNLLRGFGSMYRNRVQNIINFPELIFIVILSTI
ncbi:Hypothetical_protein [Hexamita inflata]|uniref:Hypothetical_protein n=1 Tax=Hexamita inflata TaxID=28002 RepID=A0AA86NGB5_9EUKA|nr:Hypothetical protein HINF_LOCUS6289 [Hexamita inflata]